MAVLKIKDANGDWQNIVALKGDQGERGPEGPQGPQGLPGGVTSVNGMTGDVTLQLGNDYTLPQATSSTLGGVTIGSNITVSSGKISLTSSNITSALGFTPLSTTGTAAKAAADASGNTISALMPSWLRRRLPVRRKHRQHRQVRVRHKLPRLLLWLLRLRTPHFPKHR